MECSTPHGSETTVSRHVSLERTILTGPRKKAMAEGDYLISCSTDDGAFRGVAAVTTRLVEKSMHQQKTSPTVTAALGRTLTGTALLASQLKDGQRLSVQILPEGLVGELYAEADSSGIVRGYARNPDIDIPLKGGKLDVSGAVGNKGRFSVIKDLGLKQPYMGNSSLVSGEIGEDFAYYLTISEQVPSMVSLGVLVTPEASVAAAGGVLVQRMPEASEDTLVMVESNVSNLKPVTAMLREGLLPEDMLKEALKGLNVNLYDRKPLKMACGCSRKHSYQVLKMLGRDELEKIAGEGEPVEVVCHFCNKRYTFSPEEIRAQITG